jgi:hypothetical protein
MVSHVPARTEESASRPWVVVRGECQPLQALGRSFDVGKKMLVISCLWCGKSVEQRTKKTRKYCDEICMRRSLMAKRVETVGSRCCVCGKDYFANYYRVVKKDGAQAGACGSCSSRIGAFRRRGKVLHWVPIFDPNHPPVWDVANKRSPKKLVHEKKYEPQKIACADCLFGISNNQSESGWVCSKEVAFRCQPWVSKHFWKQK